MNCPTCGAPLNLSPDKDYCRCDYCKGYYFPDKNEEGIRVFGEAAPLNCPLCEIPLVHAAMGGARFLYCGECRGNLVSTTIFADFTAEIRAQLGVREGKRETAPDPKELDRHISCPQCHDPMDAHRYGGPGNVILGSCEKCTLLWLDHGELMRIVRAPDHRPES